jgi:hypothetical protein
MKTFEFGTPLETIANARIDRRRFFRQAGMLGLGAAASGLVLSSTPAHAQQSSPQSEDTTVEIFTAALIAEDLATTFYYNGLVGPVIHDVNLAGPGGSATHVTSKGNVGNVNYLQAALSEEISHANLFREGLGGASAAGDPYQTFYFAEGTFSNLATFLATLNALENAFIGAYLNAIQEFSSKAALAATGGLSGADAQHTAADYEYFAKIAASILGVEAEHRVLGRVIGNNNPANNLCYESTDGITAVYNGSNSAVVALTPFLSPGTGPGHSLAVALKNQASVSLPCSGSIPPQ